MLTIVQNDKFSVIPAKAGIQHFDEMDTRFRGYDKCAITASILSAQKHNSKITLLRLVFVLFQHKGLITNCDRFDIG